MALDESFKRPGTVPFKWEVQPGIPKQQDPAGAAGDVPPATSPRLALPPGARAGAPLAPASCRRASSSVASAAAAPLSPPAQAPQASSHRRSMSARFATSLALMPVPFTRRGRGGGRAGAAKNADKIDADFCLLYADKIA